MYNKNMVRRAVKGGEDMEMPSITPAQLSASSPSHLPSTNHAQHSSTTQRTARNSRASDAPSPPSSEASTKSGGRGEHAWYCCIGAAPPDRPAHYAGPWLMVNTEVCLTCHHHRCPHCTTIFIPGAY